jgi:nicotinate-nucleotide adenylyltransferase
LTRARASRVFAGLPPHAAGQKIGLCGGSFNPAHRGHRHISLLALRRLGLDKMWWFVTPGNPLKDPKILPPVEVRMRKAADIAADPRIEITGAEAGFRTRYTADLVDILKRRAPHVRFVWVMGSDNLAQLDRWDRWRDIAHAVPIAVVNRPGFLLSGLNARAAHVLAQYRIGESDAVTLPYRDTPAWTFLTGPRTSASSTALRRQAAATS